MTNKAMEGIQKQIKNKEESDKRLKNIVIYNLKESTKTDAEERIIEDKGMLKKIFETSLKVKDVEVTKVIRLGKKADENGNNAGMKRPMLITLRDEGEKWKILRNAKNLKNEEDEEIKRIGISTDMTREEREENKKARNMLREKRENGENGWFIKNNKLMNRNTNQE
jgi:hypothetical protein